MLSLDKTNHILSQVRGPNMKIRYLVEIENPQTHHLKVTLKIDQIKKNSIKVFLPSWSPGSYLMREYSRHIKWIQAMQFNGEVLFHSQTGKSTWEIDWSQSQLINKQNSLELKYEIYCKELTVRTSHIDSSHAFLHGPSYLMGIVGEKMIEPEIELRFPAMWSKVSTGLKDISDNREQFKFSAPDYDHLIDSPIEIGCHETDGFMAMDKPHHLAFYGDQYPHKNDLKNDIKKIVETVARHFKNDIPYDHYLFITHFVPKLYGGLEHLNSTALQFDGRKLSNRKDYLNFLSLVGHEYFHLWNIKRIRPIELGPFDYLTEGYSTLLWLAEGLTSFMDDLFVFRAGLSTLEEYLDIVKGHLESYLNTPGRKFHSLEQSSFNAWIKLYRPDENSRNSSVSYYLKGGLVFTVLHSLLLEKGSSIDQLLLDLWSDFKARPEKGVTREDVYEMIRKIGGEDVFQQFSTMIETTQEIDFESAFKKMGCDFRWSEGSNGWLGADFEYSGERVFIKSIVLDSPAYKSGLNSGDEIIFLNGLRFLKEDGDKLNSILANDKTYEFIISRLNKFHKVTIVPEKSPRHLKEIIVVNRDLAERSFNFSDMLSQ